MLNIQYLGKVEMLEITMLGIGNWDLTCVRSTDSGMDSSRYREFELLLYSGLC